MVKVRPEDLDCAEMGAIGWILSVLATAAADTDTADTKTTHLPPSQSHLSIPLYHRDMLAIKKNNLDYKTLVNSYEGSLFHTSVYNQLGGISTNNSTTAEEQCRYHYSYADGETTDGRMIKEKLTFIMDQEAVENIVMGCSDSFGGNYSGKYAGILGLNHGISINNILLPIPSSYWHRSSSSGNGDDNGVLIDSGSSLTWFPKEVYTIFRDSFAKFTSKALYQLEHPAGIPVTFDICFRRHPFEGTTDIDFHSPIVKFHFISNSMFTASSITLTTSQLFLDMDNNTYCLAFASSSYNFTIIGSHQLQGTRLTFDLYHNNLILSPNDCS
ncbi:protein ASPARTIC PROTEASE IN GUARD CELL 2-like [Quercus lobata]|uniref:protein ASPARTIC PROTEASE IN GUARD CELL 2-like n=1 Tax=Quercus lobata TaxID=97700 RepID=UPI001246C048|nr:protein ASPARTIC PROTEASE IN GUARD CELL 2-like [Quercus lobata]